VGIVCSGSVRLDQQTTLQDNALYSKLLGRPVDNRSIRDATE